MRVGRQESESDSQSDLRSPERFGQLFAILAGVDLGLIASSGYAVVKYNGADDNRHRLTPNSSTEL